jgi:TolB-like protein/class 3 adenylate cyclase
MAATLMQRRLTAVFAADAVSYDRLSELDPATRLEALRHTLIDAATGSNNGRIVETRDDRILIEFGSVVEAARCALDIRREWIKRNIEIAPEQQIWFRIGIHLADVVVAGQALSGEGVTIALGLCAAADPGGIWLSHAAYDQVRDKVPVAFRSHGDCQLDQVARAVSVYSLTLDCPVQPIQQPASVRQMPARPISAPSAPDRHDALSPRPRLSIVVLPFTNIGGDVEQEYFVDGVTEILTTDLSRIGGSTVIARSTAFTYKGKRVDLKQVGRELGVRYVLEGSVQRGGGRLRVNVQLIDAETGSHLWAERFDKPVADLFDMQDEITARLASQLGTQLVTVEARRAAHAPDPDSMDLYFQAMARWNEGRSLNHLTASRALFERALALDPGNIEALFGIGCVDYQLGNSFMTHDRPARLAAAEAALTRVLSQTPNHAPALAWLAGVHAGTNRPEQAIAEAERAVALDRNVAMGHAAIALAKSFIGRSAETEAHIFEALRLSPRDINAFGWMMCAGLAKFYLREDEEALFWLRRSVETSRNYSLAHFFLAATLAELGRQTEAEAAARSGLALAPGFTVARFRSGPSSDNPTYLEQRERLCHGMRRAGVPAE